MSLRLAGMTWPEVAEVAAATALAVPIGSTEQHGPHLPLSTDTDIAVWLCDRLSQLTDGVLAAPPIGYGSSGEHAGFTGTLSIGQDALESLIVELVRSADAFAGTILVSAHGGNAEPLDRAVGRLQEEGRRVMAWSPPPTDDAHAGRTETSILLSLAPACVRTDHVAPGDTRPIGQLMPVLRSEGVAAVSPSGVLGDPSGAHAQLGVGILATWEADLASAVRRWR